MIRVLIDKAIFLIVAILGCLLLALPAITIIGTIQSLWKKYYS
ncbi:MAG: hypothetical protein DK305_000565 [Chloroflexi bacterium]|jgi:hypothetical protein|nr:MAG: hypothetical protein DK305_000565 [Chloroflexota bacterium]